MWLRAGRVERVAVALAATANFGVSLRHTLVVLVMGEQMSERGAPR